MRKGVLDLAVMLVLHRGDVIRVTANAQGDPTQIACTLPEVIDQVRVGERIWFDDGRIGGVIRNITDDALEVEITQAREGGEKLTADKGINLPDSELDLAALTEKDLLDLQCAAQEATRAGDRGRSSGCGRQALRWSWSPARHAGAGPVRVR